MRPDQLDLAFNNALMAATVIALHHHDRDEAFAIIRRFVESAPDAREYARERLVIYKSGHSDSAKLMAAAIEAALAGSQKPSSPPPEAPPPADDKGVL
jgi:hypothetical protein